MDLFGMFRGQNTVQMHSPTYGSDTDREPVTLGISELSAPANPSRIATVTSGDDMVSMECTNRAEGASYNSAVFNLSTCIVGAGIMALPSTFKILGIPLGIFALIGVGLLTEVSLRFLIRHTYARKAWSYSEQVNVEFGPTARQLVNLCVILGTLGFTTAYMIIIGDVLSGTSGRRTFTPGLLYHWAGGSYWWNNRYVVILFTMVFILSPLVSLKRFDSLSFTSLVAFLLAVFFIILLVIVTLIKVMDGSLNTQVNWGPDFGSSDFWGKVWGVLPVMGSAYVCHIAVHPIFAELADRTADTMISVARTSLFMCATVYLITSTAGYLLFGAAINTDLLVNFDQNLGISGGNVVNTFARIAYVLHIMLVFPVIFFPLRGMVDDALYPDMGHLTKDNTRFYGITVGLMVVVYIGSVAVPDIWIAFDITGATSVMIIAFLFPALFALRDHATPEERTIAKFMIGFAAVVAVTGLASSLYDIAKKNAMAPA